MIGVRTGMRSIIIHTMTVGNRVKIAAGVRALGPIRKKNLQIHLIALQGEQNTVLS
jgi:hypothetical protein